LDVESVEMLPAVSARTAAMATPSVQFGDLCARAAACTACPRMAQRAAVVSERNGSVPARVVFVAEAPGRLGGDRSGVPLSSDQAGNNFARLLQAAGISRDEVFVTNAVLCNPRDAAGNNAPPATAEIRRCSAFLDETLRVVDPLVVVTLGAVALRALDIIVPHDIVVRDSVAIPVRWNGRWLMPLNHPGARALIHRPFLAQVDDYRRLVAFLCSVDVVRNHDS
jgi:uracil-DNA glycosylase family 4